MEAETTPTTPPATPDSVESVRKGEKGRVDFSTLKGFKNIEKDDKIVTQEFFDSTLEIVQVFSTLGMIFKPVINDMHGNITKLQNVYGEDVEKYNHLDEFIFITAKVPNNITSTSLFWLTRLLELLEAFLTNVANDETCDNNLKDCLKAAYKATLEKHHNFIVREMFSIAYRLIPSRVDLFGSEDKYADNITALNAYLPAARTHLADLNRILDIIK